MQNKTLEQTETERSLRDMHIANLNLLIEVRTQQGDDIGAAEAARELLKLVLGIDLEKAFGRAN